jgi:small conductance mechanosensitive channel
MNELLNKFNFTQFSEEQLLPWGLNILFALFILVVGLRVARGLSGLVKRMLERAGMARILVDFVGGAIKGLLVLLVIMAALDRLGVDTTSLVALVGAAGLAVGLSLQSSLQNFAAGVMLILLRPFRIGDYIEAAGTAGSVEQINIFSTQLGTPDNRTVTVPNGAIYQDKIVNHSARETRRVDLEFSIGYGDDIGTARDLIAGLLSADPRILKHPEPIIAVGELGDSSVNLLVRPWVKTADYWGVYWDLTEQVKLAFDAGGITIPYPQMDVHMPRT